MWRVLNRPSIWIPVLLVLLSTGLGAQSEETASDVDLSAVVKDYFAKNVEVFQAGSTVEEIDKIFDMFTDDFTYVHPKYGGVYSRDRLYEGYVRNQEAGRYDGSVADIKIVNVIRGLDAVVVEKCFVNRGDEGLEEDESQMTLFEFKDGKISKIVEYW